MKPKSVLYLVPYFKDYHAKNLAWGSLHVALEDHNLKNSDVDFCIRYAKENGDKEGEGLGRLLRQCSISQRRKIARLA